MVKNGAKEDNKLTAEAKRLAQASGKVKNIEEHPSMMEVGAAEVQGQSDPANMTSQPQAEGLAAWQVRRASKFKSADEYGKSRTP